MPHCNEQEILIKIDELEREITILRCELIAETESKMNPRKTTSQKFKALFMGEPIETNDPHIIECLEGIMARQKAIGAAAQVETSPTEVQR